MNQRYLDALGLVYWESRYQLPDADTESFIGIGNEQANVVIVSEYLTDHANALLTAMMESIGLKRHDVYLATLPTLPHEDKCKTELLAKITAIQPKLLLLVGQTATQCLLDIKTEWELLRQQIHFVSTINIPAIATYHPAYLLINPQHKKKAYADLLLAAQQLHSV
jgi:uracil-DNA glycosylase family 4